MSEQICIDYLLLVLYTEYCFCVSHTERSLLSLPVYRMLICDCVSACARSPNKNLRTYVQISKHVTSVPSPASLVMHTPSYGSNSSKPAGPKLPIYTILIHNSIPASMDSLNFCDSTRLPSHQDHACAAEDDDGVKTT